MILSTSMFEQDKLDYHNIARTVLFALLLSLITQHLKYIL